MANETANRPPLYTVESRGDGWSILYQGRPIGEWFKRKCDAMRKFNRFYGTYNDKRNA